MPEQLHRSHCCSPRRPPALTPQALANWLGLLVLLALGVVWPL